MGSCRYGKPLWSNHDFGDAMLPQQSRLVNQSGYFIALSMKPQMAASIATEASFQALRSFKIQRVTKNLHRWYD
jgi:hypothetical protein